MYLKKFLSSPHFLQRCCKRNFLLKIQTSTKRFKKINYGLFWNDKSKVSFMKYSIKEPLKKHERKDHREDEAKSTPTPPNDVLKTRQFPKTCFYERTLPLCGRVLIKSCSKFSLEDFPTSRQSSRKLFILPQQVLMKSNDDLGKKDTDKSLGDNHQGPVAGLLEFLRRLFGGGSRPHGGEPYRGDNPYRGPWTTEEWIQRSNDPFKRYEGGDRERHLQEEEKKEESPQEEQKPPEEGPKEGPSEEGPSEEK